MEETRIAVMSIIVEDRDSAEPLNQLLHSYGSYIIGRMGLPYEKKNISLMAIALDAPENTIAELAGKVGNLPHVSVKTAYAKRLRESPRPARQIGAGARAYFFGICGINRGRDGGTPEGGSRESSAAPKTNLRRPGVHAGSHRIYELL